MSVKKFFKNLSTRIWFIVSCCLGALLLVLNVALAVPTVQDFATLIFGVSTGTSTGSTEGSDYYPKTTSSKDEARENGDTFNVKLAEEGIVMLKNKDNAFPLPSGTKVSVFGKNSAGIVYGGSGSGAVDSSKAKTLHDSLTAVGFKVNPELEAFYASSASGAGRPNNPSDLDSGRSVSLETGETPLSMYTDKVKSSYSSYNDLALVVLSRIGGEGFDLPRTSAEEGKHYLELDKNEIDMIKHVQASGFKKVAIVINSGNAFELGFTKTDYEGILADKIDGVFLMPGTGTTGVMALGEILSGSVNPSGHTVDTYATDFTAAPSFQNFGDNSKDNGDLMLKEDGTSAGFYFVDYEENIYVGYRYYETRAAVEGETWYQNNVVYPFGYGLSYTSFSYELVDQDSLPTTLTTEEFKVKVKVTNTGTKAGKAVAQLYGHAPYYAGKIEKSEVQLVDFGKTSLLEPGASEVLELNVNPYYMASYDYKDQNGDGFKGYTLDSGDYTFSVRTDAHTLAGSTSFQLNLPSTIKYEKDPVTDTVVKNLYTDNKERYLDSDYHLQTLLSRSDFNGTFPVTPTGDDYKLTQAEIKILEDRNPNNPNTYEMPNLEVPEEDADLMLYDLFEKNEDGTIALDENGRPYVLYDNPKWESLLNKVSLDKAKEMMNRAAFHTIEIPEIDKPRTYETDGPAGIVNFMFTSEYYGCAAYCSETLVGMTFNQELAEEWGETVGEESLWGDITTVNGEVVTKAPYSGWYAPGVNIHRSPFGGRNFEYYSEDPVHTGKMAAAEIRGTRRKGMYTFMKHFALNEQETHRSINGDISYCTEQAMREIYLKAFEIAVKEGKSLGIMSSFNRIGLKWTGGDYRLLTTILRDEWGFRGAVIDDLNTPGYMPVKQMCYAGGDLNLSTTRSWSKTDWNNANDVTVIRKALKNTLYVVANSNNMNGHGEGIVHSAGKPIYKNIQLAVNIVLPIIIIGWGAPVIILVARKKEEPVNVGE